MTFQTVASLIDDTRVVIYNHNMFIIHITIVNDDSSVINNMFIIRITIVNDNCYVINNLFVIHFMIVNDDSCIINK